MNSAVFWEALLISSVIIVLCGVPLLSKKVRAHSKFFFLLGTGALAGICFFELLPNVFQMGHYGLMITGIVWVVYSILHLFHIGHHHKENHSESAGDFWSVSVFLGSMMAHCFSSGMLLVLSDEQGFGKTVFLALLAHKTYEALTVSSILLDTLKKQRTFFIAIVLYAVSFPLGVAGTVILGKAITQNIALVATSVAVGSLLGCLIFDFLLPSLTHVKTRRHDVAWIAAGLVFTQLIFWVL